MGILLFIISIIVSIILQPSGLIYGLIYFKNYSKKLKNILLSLDRIISVIYTDIFNDFLVNNNSFIDGHETISETLNNNINNLTKLGHSFIKMSYLLKSIVYLILFISSPVSLLYSLTFNFYLVNKRFRNLAESIDRLGNVTCSELFDDTLITNEGHKFGNGRETISSAIGRNHMFGTLNKFGKKVSDILSKCFEEEHAIKAIGNRPIKYD